MSDETEIKCPFCGSEHYKLFKDTPTFDGIIYRKVCLNCGRKFD